MSKKMIRPRVLVLRAPGTNCDMETAHAFQLAGANPTAIHVNQLVAQPGLLDDFQILCFPGGFSFGDDISAGQILANRLRTRISDSLKTFRDRGNLVLGICNGFQVLVKTGLLDNEDEEGTIQASLTWNTNGRYTAKWVSLKAPQSRCVFLEGVGDIHLPIAHGEGRFVVMDEARLRGMEAHGQIALRYAAENNPNGSTGDVAGICDRTGRVFGLMPHPERNVHLTHHPRWTRLPRSRKPDGLSVFENAVRHFSA